MGLFPFLVFYLPFMKGVFEAMDTVPDIADGGSDGSQIVGIDNQFSMSSAASSVGYGLEAAIKGIAANKPKGLGGDIPAALYAGAYSQAVQDLSETKRLLAKEYSASNKLKADLESARIENAVLKSNLDAVEKEKTARSICLVFGTSLFGIGIDRCYSGQYALGALLFSIGLVLGLFGLYLIRGGKSK
ncbi:hypothetical protein [Aeromonas salmonicida]|uniref:hypothetical protein n=1 Tax=Aeromonas salmonicida TaxID=645 RepID=UPI001F3C38E9|nr:hypothetical protein [Aeromonas salmonicida]MCE9936356.1 hypothetical protein [Aeromonas salmonicida]